MAASVHVVARFVAKAGKEDALKSVLAQLIPPTRRELGCYQFDLLENPSSTGDLCFVERWENEKSADQHVASEHVKKTLSQVETLVEIPPDIRRYHQI
jgi:quinol monooxygenase YgiN